MSQPWAAPQTTSPANTDDLGGLLSETWRLTKAQLPMLLAAFLLSMAISFGGIFVSYLVLLVPMLAVTLGVEASGLDKDTAGIVSMLILLPFIIVFYAFVLMLNGVVYIMLTKSGLSAARGEQVDIGSLFHGLLRKSWRFSGMVLVMTFAVLPSALLLYIPAIYLTIRWSLAMQFLVDTDLGAMDCLRASWRATDGKVLDLFVKNLVFGLVAMVGIIATCYLGMFVLIPMQMVLGGLLYVKLTGRDKSGLPDPDMYAI